ncbi:MAG: hypothetical protein Q9223_004186 [Gallowayella weberi]
MAFSKESATSTINFPEDKVCHIKLMLDFLYTHSYDPRESLPPIENHKDRTIKLLETTIALCVLGDKYAIPSLCVYSEHYFRDLLDCNRSSCDADVPLTCIPLVYANALENAHILQAAVIEEVVWCFSNTQNRKYKIKLIEMMHVEEAFRKDMTLRLVKNLEGNYQPVNADESFELLD